MPNELLISLIIPLFNEEENVENLYHDVTNVMNGMGTPYEMILVDDGSGDATRDKVSVIAAADARVKAVNLRRNFGQTAAIMAGIDQSAGDVIVTMDGDLQNDPQDIPLVLEKLREGYDVCSGWRKDRQDPFWTKVLPSRIANAMISWISGVHLKDYGCTLKAYRKDVIKKVRLYGEMHRFIPIYATWEGARVTEIPVRHHPRRKGKSKYGLERTFKVILDLMVVKFLASYAQKPIYLFGGFGLLNVGLSLLSFLLMVYYKFWGGKTFIQTPLPLLVVLFMLVGVISILLGLIAELLMRTYYESQGKPTYLLDRRDDDPSGKS